MVHESTDNCVRILNRNQTNKYRTKEWASRNNRRYNHDEFSLFLCYLKLTNKKRLKSNMICDEPLRQVTIVPDGFDNFMNRLKEESK